ncbi:MAG: polyprenyl synthetase family protein [Oscillospiraceae bacterium]|jgi:geranylgeranyl pyrophosphate synthase|nr:polyprenyl synthetase family protein [Oscillospiraceae bacterium]
MDTSNAYIAQLERELSAQMNKLDNGFTNIGKALQYAVESGGKRIRPTLLMRVCEAFGGSVEGALPAAAALEMVHTFSLVHDDLPCMDDDDYRRGKVTCHRMFGEAAALLAGDALVIHAFGSLADGYINSSPKVGLRLVAELTEAAGVHGMTGGQDADLLFMSKKPDSRDLIKMYVMKTAALFRFACRAGAVCAEADEESVDTAGLYGERLGLAFQLTDDLLDLGQDESVGKVTFATINGFDVTKFLLQEAVAHAKGFAAKLPDSDYFIRLAEFIENRKK